MLRRIVSKSSQRVARTPSRAMSNIIGIDLGTTNSCVAVMDGEEAKVIPNEEGKRTTPSIVAYTKEGQRLVGIPAARQAVSNPENTFFATKRLIGRRYDDPNTTKDKSRVPYKIVSSPAGDAWLEAFGKKYSPEQVGASILTKMRDTAAEYLGNPVGEAVVTVPAYFNDQQRQATRDAGRIAGLNVRRIINEPTAAALAYGINNKEDQTLAVYDLGGGTFDVSVLQISKSVFQVMSTNGDTFLGGEDFDNAVMAHLIEEFKAETGIDLTNDMFAKQRLKEASEKAKMELDAAEKTEINLPYIQMAADGPKHLTLTLTKTKLDAITKKLIDRTAQPCTQAMKDAGVTTNDIKQVLLVGGMSRSPTVQKFVAEIFSRQPSKAVNPDEVVAQGAALQGAVLQGSVKDVVLVDVTPLSLGTSDSQGLFVRLINRNSAIPCKQSKTFSTVQDGQTAIQVQVLQGEREVAKHNKLLGQFVLPNIPPAKKGVPQITISFEIDANGVVTASAKDEKTGTTRNVAVQTSGGLSSSEVDRMVAEAERFAEQDKAAKRLAEIKHSADSTIYSTENSISEFEEKLTDEQKKDIQNTLDALKEAVAKAEGDESPSAEAVKDLEEKLEACKEASFKIGEAVYGRGGGGGGENDSADKGEGDKSKQA